MYWFNRVGIIMSGHKCVWAQSCLGTIMPGHKRGWAQTWMGQTCVGTVMWSQLCGPNHVWAQTWWNPGEHLVVSLENIDQCISLEKI